MFVSNMWWAIERHVENVVRVLACGMMSARVVLRVFAMMNSRVVVCMFGVLHVGFVVVIVLPCRLAKVLTLPEHQRFVLLFRPA